VIYYYYKESEVLTKVRLKMNYLFALRRMNTYRFRCQQRLGLASADDVTCDDERDWRNWYSKCGGELWYEWCWKWLAKCRDSVKFVELERMISTGKVAK